MRPSSPYFKLFLFLLVLSGPLNSQAQESLNDFGQIKAKHSYHVDLALPGILSNQAFKDLMQGVVQSGAGYRFSLQNGLYLGADYQYSIYKLDPFQLAESFAGNVQIHGTMLTLGIENYPNERLGIGFQCGFGPSWTQFRSDSLQVNPELGPKQIQSWMLRPEFSLSISASNQTSVSWSVGYALLGHHFAPGNMGIQDDLGYTPSSLSRPLQLIYFGFKFTHYFVQWN